MGEYLSKPDRTKDTETGGNEKVSFVNQKLIFLLDAICCSRYARLETFNGRLSYRQP